ncbi:MAG TPA: GPW/gp25 family protein [Bacteroidales bacterium]|nr:GPW/gp25 family protein [Bacteroidales bacterium]
MANIYLQIPLKTQLITQQKELDLCSLSESVAGMIHLIATTHFGENKHDITFGNELWDYDFENIDNVQAFKEKLAGSLRETIIGHEKRLSDVRVNINFEQVITKALNRRVKQKIEINVEGILIKTNEEFKHTEMFYMGPLSYY